MNSPEQSSSSLFWWPNILVMAMMAVGILNKPQTLISARPTGVQGTKSDPVQPGQRLWEDPLQLPQAAPSGKDLSPLSWLAAKPATITLEQQLALWVNQDLDSDDNHVCFMFVALPPGGYAEEEERRLRFRYAMQAATGYAGYKADDLTPMEIKRVQYDDREHTVAKEVFHPFSPERSSWLAKKYDTVMVIYLSDFLFERGKAPLQHWRSVLNSIDHDCQQLHGSSPKKLSFHIMGPSNSDRLVNLCSDLCTAEADEKTKKMSPHGDVWFHACLPTLASEILLKLAVDGAPDDLNGQEAFHVSCRKLLAGKKTITASKLGVTLRRVAGDDHDLCRLMFEELVNRGVVLTPARSAAAENEPADTSQRPDDSCLLAIISEWDTTYGRSFPLTFNEVIRENVAATAEQPAGQPDWSWRWEDQDVASRTLCRFSYLRGLDGQLPDDPAKNEHANNDAKDKPPAVDHPQGRSQADYVHRIVERMQAIEQKEGRTFRAIGILGSDVYDKLMILRALRSAFQNAVFFTTDLDAAMADPGEYDWSQNLIVASRFGLRANEVYQGWSPPFRDGYQTGFYLSSLEALGFTYCNSVQRNLPHMRPIDWEAPPLLFEIGRNGPWQLTPPRPMTVAEMSFMMESKKGEEPIIDDQPKGNPQPLPLQSLTGSAFPLSLTFLTILVAALMVGSMRREQRLVSAPRSCIAIILFAVFMAWFWAVGICGWLLNATEEPFLFWNGISIWPSTLLHATIPCLCIHYFWTSWLNLSLNRDSIQKDYASSGLLPKRSAAGARASDALRLKNKPWQVFRAYRSHLHMPDHWKHHPANCGIVPCLVRTLVYYSIYCLLRYLCFLSLPHIHSDLVRGYYSRLLTAELVPALALMAFLILLFYAVDACLVCAALLRTAIHHVNALDVHGGSSPAHEVRRLIKMCASSGDIVASFIYYPFIVLFILITARHRVLDGFDWPLTALITYASSLLILVIITTVLQGTASRLKKTAIRAMETGREFASGNDHVNEAPRQTDMDNYDVTLKYLNEMNSPVFSTVYSNPVFRAMLIPLGGTGALHGLDLLSSVIK